jgi:glycosyltransferase involved in cell wall biosynthesis
MDETQLISVVTCFLNQESFLEEAIMSVINQTYTKWQLILINDGSTDKSSEIAKYYSALYPREIIYREHAGGLNLGTSKSRNLGIKISDGEFVTFLDGDDVWLPKYLENQISIFNKYPKASLVCEASEYWYSWHDDSIKDIITQVGGPQNSLGLPPQLALILYPLGHGAAPCICGMTVRKTALLKSGLFDEDFTGMYEDQTLLIKLYLTEPVFISSTCYNRYRQRPNSLVATSHSSGDYFTVRGKFLRWLEDYLQHNPKKYPAIDSALKKLLFPYDHPHYYRLINLARRVKNRISLIIRFTS